MKTCKLCGEKSKGKKGYCKTCRILYPFKGSPKGQYPFNRLKEASKN
jgi:hypothetical protein